MVLVELAAFGVVVALIPVVPRIAAACISAAVKRVLQDRALGDKVRQRVKRSCTENEDLVPALFWNPSTRRGLQVALTGVFLRQDFHGAVANLAQDLTKDQVLQDSIREGVLEALRDVRLRSELKHILIENVHDRDLQNAVRRAAISSVKVGIREAVTDQELKEVIAAAIRDALEDPRLNELLRGALKDALADQELHRAAVHGVVRAWNPLNMPAARSGESRRTPRAAEREATEGGGREEQPDSPELNPVAGLIANVRGKMQRGHPDDILAGLNIPGCAPGEPGHRRTDSDDIQGWPPTLPPWLTRMQM
mmetsp:Transcript_45067/g.97875  ORF Transcript_45067/g.97875 Transcript_45067/m.97875 type:complete len:309 (-) Transcript_45067:103-1029(-)